MTTPATHPKRQIADYPGIQKAALCIACDNGMINRLEPAEEFLAKVSALISIPDFDDDIAAVEAWLTSLSEQDLETFCTGESEDAHQIGLTSPPSTVIIAEEIFNL